jgi:hypothetical protein
MMRVAPVTAHRPKVEKSLDHRLSVSQVFCGKTDHPGTNERETAATEQTPQ